MEEDEKLNKEEKWAQIIAQAKESGETVSAWCAAHQVSVKQFYYWKKKFSVQQEDPDQEESQSFVELAGPPASENREPADNDNKIQAILKYKDFKLIILKQTSSATIEKIVQVMCNA